MATNRRPKKTPEAEAADTKVKDAFKKTVAENADEFDKTARMLIGAVDALNEALAAAHRNGEMRVELWPVEGPLPRTYNYRIYRLSHASMTWMVEHKDKDTGEIIKASYKPTTEKPDVSATAVRGDLDRHSHKGRDLWRAR